MSSDHCARSYRPAKAPQCHDSRTPEERFLDQMRRNLTSDDDGLVAVGGTLHPDVLERAYRMGVFPWSSEPAVTWWCPDPRAVFDLATFQPSRSLRKRIRHAGWTFHVDRDFEGTMRRCGEPTPERPETWITDDFVAAYGELFRRGEAHSVEVYEGDLAVGGLYGVAMGGYLRRRVHVPPARRCLEGRPRLLDLAPSRPWVRLARRTGPESPLDANWGHGRWRGRSS